MSKNSNFSLGSVHSVVVYPLTTQDVVKIVKIAVQYKMPLIPYSGGTSLEGHTRGVRKENARIVQRADLSAVCQWWNLRGHV